MSDGTKIEWTDATWNVVNGCSVTSPGCTNCYAMRLAGTRLKHHPSRAGLTIDTKAGPVWTGETRFNDKVLLDPLRWRRPRRIFVCAHGDLFHDSVPDEWIDRVFAVMALAPQHQFQVLTKRSARMRRYFAEPVRKDGRGRELEIYDQWLKMRAAWREAPMSSREYDWSHLSAQGLGSCENPLPLHNVWLGVSVEDQARADQRIPDLLATPAAVRWISAEPLLGAVDLNDVAIGNRENGVRVDALTGCEWDDLGPRIDGDRIDWVVAGGESGPGARPMRNSWARSMRDQCAASGVPFLFKQWGDWRPYDQLLDDCTGRDPTGEYGNKESHHVLDADEQPGTENIVVRVGKRASGRLLDGVQHDGFPA